LKNNGAASEMKTQTLKKGANVVTSTSLIGQTEEKLGTNEGNVAGPKRFRDCQKYRRLTAA
jgi:hypothetical protein